jgi:hypothetical protein
MISFLMYSWPHKDRKCGRDQGDRGNDMDKLKANRNLIYIGVIAVAVIAMIVMVMQFRSEKEAQASEAAQNVTITEMKKKKLTEPKITVETKVIEDGLSDMGFLVTQEYYFTQVERYTKETKVFGLVPSESEILYSYDGSVQAGIDFEKIEITKDDDTKKLTVTLPPSEINAVIIDEKSFKAYSEKDYLWNRIQLEDYSRSRVQFENAARKKAIDSGILDRADDQAMKLVMNFIRSIPDAADYTVAFE